MVNIKQLADKYSRKYCLQKVEVHRAFQEHQDDGKEIPEAEEKQIHILLHHCGRALKQSKHEKAGYKASLKRKKHENDKLHQDLEEIKQSIAVMQRELMALRGQSSRSSSSNSKQSVGLSEDLW